MRFDIEPIVEHGFRKEVLPNWIRRCEGDCEKNCEGKRERKNNGESEAVVEIMVRCCMLMLIVVAG